MFNKNIKVMIALLFMILAFGSVVQSQDLNDQSSSRPSHEKTLGENSFEEFNVYRLKNAKVLYHNPELMKDYGINPDSLSAKELNEKILESFAWMSESVDEKFRTTESRLAYAYYYGGEGMGMHKGSARAGIVGDVQIKGIGLTPMHNDSHHAHKEGYAGLHESIKEVIWGEFLSRTLPYGANRVVALIETGITTMGGEPAVLIIREDPLRAGHFVRRTVMSDEKDKERVKQNLKKLSNVLPSRDASQSELSKHLPSDASSKLQAHVASVDEWLYRLTRQLAKVHLQRIYHGATSESNININGQYIDYGTSSTNSGFGRIQFLPHVEPFGLYGEIDRVWGAGMARKFLEGKKGLSADFIESVQSVYNKYLNNALLSETLVNLGVPEAKVVKAMGKQPINEVAKLLFEVVNRASDASNFDIQNNPMPKSTSTIDFKGLLLSLVESVNEPSEFKVDYEKFGFVSSQEKRLLDRIKTQWAKTAPALIEVLGPEVASPKDFLRHSVMWSNRDRPMLYRDVLKENTEKVEAFAKAKPAESLVNKVSELVTETLEASEPKLAEIDTNKFIPIRKLRSNSGVGVLEVYSVEANAIEKIKIGSKKTKKVEQRSCRKIVN